MKVYYSDHIFSSQRYGGVSRIFAEIIPRIATQRIEVGYLGCTHINDYFDPPAPTPSHHVPWLPRPFRRAANDLVERHFLRTRRPDIVHVTYYPTAARTRRYKGCRLAVTVYDMIHERMPHKVSASDPTPHLKRAVCAEADLIFAISEHTKADLVELYNLPSDKIVVTHLASSLSSSLTSSLAPASSSVSPRPFFLYVGARAGYKNFSLVVESFAEFAKSDDDAELVCFGGPPLQEAELAEFQRRGLLGRVRHLTGGDALLAAHYQAAIALIYPSLYEGFGIPPLEAMGQGCPVISSNTSSLPEVVGSAGLLFDPTNPDALLKAMRSIHSSKDTRQNLIALGTQREQRFRWDQTALQTLAGYRLVF